MADQQDSHSVCGFDPTPATFSIMSMNAAMPDPCDYIRKTYGAPAAVGGRVRIGLLMPVSQTGTIKSADHYLYVLMDGEKDTRRFHPTHCIDYLNHDGSVAASYGDED